jgi:hypothetical protein
MGGICGLIRFPERTIPAGALGKWEALTLEMWLRRHWSG